MKLLIELSEHIYFRDIALIDFVALEFSSSRTRLGLYMLNSPNTNGLSTYKHIELFN